MEVSKQYFANALSGYFKLPETKVCTDPGHNFPTHLYIPPGSGYRHVCPSCGSVSTAINPN